MTNSELNALRLRVIRVMQSIRNIPRPLNPGAPDKAKTSETWEGNLGGHPADRLVIYLRSSGCTWAMSHHKPDQFLAGCLDCEHSVAGTTYGRPISAEDYIKQFMDKFQNFKARKCPILCLYNEGSFFNEEELPARARRHILKSIAAEGHVRRLVLESLPNYITDDVLSETVELLKGVELEIGVGLESSSEIVRSLCVNKPYNLKAFEGIIPIVRRHGRLLAYVMLKPSFLSEKEAIDDTNSTVRYAFAAGADAVSIEPVSIGRYTMSGALYHLDLYKPAWLWSVLECAKVAAGLGEVRIGGYQFAPSYIYYAINCKFCSSRVKDEIKSFNETYDVQKLKKINCPLCVGTWRSELDRKYPALETRIREQLDQVESFLKKPNLYQLLEPRG